MTEIMLDLETGDNRPGGAIFSIGAVEFDPIDQVLGREFYIQITQSSLRRNGFTFGRETMAWWARQSYEAQKVIRETEAGTNSFDIDEALGIFRQYLQPLNLNRVRIWGMGSDFDCSLLTAAYNRMEMVPPWKFWNTRCHRTLKGNISWIDEPLREGVYHNALDDAKHQARHANLCLAEIIKMRRQFNDRANA